MSIVNKHFLRIVRLLVFAALAVASLSYTTAKGGSNTSSMPDAAAAVMWELPHSAPPQAVFATAAANYVAMNNRGGWVIIFGRNGYDAQGVPQGLITALQKANSGQERMIGAALGDSGQWVLISDKFVRSGSLPNAMRTALSQILDGRNNVTYAAFSGNGWVIGYGQNGYRSQGLPRGAANALRDLNNRQESISGAAFTSGGGYAIWYGRNGAMWAGVPTDFASELRRINRNDQTIRSVALYKSTGWVVLYGSGGYTAVSVPRSLVQALQ
jgi:hypothetical protein